MNKKGLYLKIFGNVQGVGFRYFAREKAGQLGLVGWVRNNSDGTVSCEIFGEEEALKKFLKWAKSGPKWAKVEKVEERWREYKDEFEEFEIQY